MSAAVLRRGAVALAVFSLAAASTATAAPLTKREDALLDAMNSARAAYALPPFRVDGRLQRVAHAHSAQILRSDSFMHGSFAYRIRRVGVRAPALGENLAWGVGSLGSARAFVRAWLASPDHRANLLRRGFRRVGVGVVSGEFAGYPRAVVATVDFAGS